MRYSLVSLLTIVLLVLPTQSPAQTKRLGKWATKMLSKLRGSAKKPPVVPPAILAKAKHQSILDFARGSSPYTRPSFLDDLDSEVVDIIGDGLLAGVRAWCAHALDPSQLQGSNDRRTRIDPRLIEARVRGVRNHLRHITKEEWKAIHRIAHLWDPPAKVITRVAIDIAAHSSRCRSNSWLSILAHLPAPEALTLLLGLHYDHAPNIQEHLNSAPGREALRKALLPSATYLRVGHCKRLPATKQPKPDFKTTTFPDLLTLVPSASEFPSVYPQSLFEAALPGIEDHHKRLQRYRLAKRHRFSIEPRIKQSKSTELVILALRAPGSPTQIHVPQVAPMRRGRPSRRRARRRFTSVSELHRLCFKNASSATILSCDRKQALDKEKLPYLTDLLDTTFAAAKKQRPGARASSRSIPTFILDATAKKGLLQPAKLHITAGRPVGACYLILTLEAKK